MSATYGRDEVKEWVKDHIRGIFVTMCLPETAESEIDEAGIRHDIRYYLGVSKVHGIYCHGLYGNFYALTVEERKRATEIIVEAVNNAVRVVCSCEHACLKDTLDLIRHAEATGVDLIALTGPWLSGNSEAVIINYFEYIASQTRLGILVDNIDYIGYSMSPELMARLAKITNVAVLKNVMPMAHTIRLRQLVGDSIAVVDPTEENLLVNMVQFGQKAVFDGGAMLYDSAVSTPMRDYVEAGLQGDAKRCAELFYGMQPLRDVYEKWVADPWHQTNLFPLTAVKCWTQQLGLTGGPTRPPAIPMSDADTEALIADLRAVGKLPKQAAQRG